jgi:protocatechuate 3,4-dioxygenase beta subunit
MSNSRLARRNLIRGSLALAGTSWLLGSQGTAAATLPLTPQQTPGPFYPLSFPQDSDNDLVHVSGIRIQPRALSRELQGTFST